MAQNRRSTQGKDVHGPLVSNRFISGIKEVDSCLLGYIDVVITGFIGFAR